MIEYHYSTGSNMTKAIKEITSISLKKFREP